MPEIEKVFTCVVCGARFDSKRALGGHMRWHPKGSYVRTSFSCEKEKWKAFSDVCEKHGTTTCSVLGALIDATVAGEKAGLVTIPSQNPIMVQVNHVVLGAPRGRYSHINAAEIGRSIAQGEVEPVGCPFIGGLRPGQVLCRKSGSRWQSRAECSSCSANWIKFPYTRKCQ